MNNISFNYETELIKLNEFLSSRGVNNFTSYVRIDKQIKDLFGDYLYVLNLLRKNKIQSEIAWHPHLYAKSDHYYILTDSNCACRQLWDIYNANPVVREMTSIRIGSAQMDNNMMAALNNMKNFTNDSSALPGVSRNDQYRKLDWSITGNSPYYPFVNNYRCSGQPSHNILEIPITTIPIATPYSTRRRYINPSIRKEIFQPAFSTYQDYLSYIVIVMHPDQLISGYQDDLYEFGFDNFISNFDFIVSSFSDIKFKTMKQVTAEWKR